ncbi:hypothetical protein J6590_001098 [Homalodisca vitripennis]|nr:hypothetical protein J6590_001098 [Homalodisca vitripennis]
MMKGKEYSLGKPLLTKEKEVLVLVVWYKQSEKQKIWLRQVSLISKLCRVHFELIRHQDFWISSYEQNPESRSQVSDSARFQTLHYEEEQTMLGRADYGGKSRIWWEEQTMVGRADYVGKSRLWWEEQTMLGRADYVGVGKQTMVEEQTMLGRADWWEEQTMLEEQTMVEEQTMLGRADYGGKSRLCWEEQTMVGRADYVGKSRLCWEEQTMLGRADYGGKS